MFYTWYLFFLQLTNISYLKAKVKYFNKHFIWGRLTKRKLKAVWPQTTLAYFKKNPKTAKAKSKFQKDA